jgi:polyisoprenoid-binding protein YceI
MGAMDDNPPMMALPRVTFALVLLTGTMAHASDEAASAHGGMIFLVDPQGSEVAFLMNTTWHAVHGKARGVSGTIESAKGALFEDAVVSIVVDATTLETGNTRRDKTMHADYMMTGEWPRIAFRSTAPPVLVGKDHPASPAWKDMSGTSDEGVISLELAGDLTIRSETRGVILALTAVPDGDGWVVTGEHTVSLQDYGLPDPSIFLNRVQDAVKVSFTVRAHPAQSVH